MPYSMPDLKAMATTETIFGSPVRLRWVSSIDPESRDELSNQAYLAYNQTTRFDAASL